jgi:hypothetical protein
MASDETLKKTVPENVEDKPASAVSEHTTNNPQTPNKSKQPARRKAKSVFQPGFHGRLLQFVMYDEKAKPIEGLKNLFVSLADRFDFDDVVNALLIELAVTDYWRLSQVVQFEASSPTNVGAYPQLTHYLTASRRNLDKSLQMLLQLDKEAAEAGAFATEAETEASAVDAASPSQPTSMPTESDEQSTPAASSTSADEAAADEPQPTAAESTATEGVAETPAVEAAGEKPAADLPAANLPAAA